eukprot:CAMPEP_0206186618 /NCGR_PEP_ID=MMETSP0166-20121206/2507_1 /ASSEMBLY_ACC=CAM_ASM_000260 /TAXON_ID=95228 /ORGANISM="Vannella robusta, Strain DIVA3 518/3/11/1/6" /LENGTH=218 /DNA_ID=CAMNT_0053602031 /DNA_START=37 /DNA_END=693 /DNA_ORIENTATION=+
MADGEEGVNEYLYKVLVVGDIGTGKTSIIKRYVHNIFSMHYKSTIGVDFALKVINWDENSVVRLQLWDIAGQERFGNMTRVYYKEAVGAFVVFDVTRVSTFEAVQKWKSDMDAKVFLSDNRPIPVVLLANKCDLAGKEGICQDRRQMDKFCEENGFIGWFETSAKSSVGIEDAAKCLVGKILEDSKASQPAKDKPDSIKITKDSNKPPPRPQDDGGCC